MHLKSSNGAIDVLVCPEDETQSQCLHSPHPPSISTANGMCATRAGYPALDPPPPAPCTPELLSATSQSAVHPQKEEPDPVINHVPVSRITKLEDGLRQEGLALDHHHHHPHTITPSYPQVTVTGPSSELDISLSSAADVNGDDLGFMDRLLPIDMGMFDHLSPTLQTDDFSFSMDNSTEGIHDLFDL